MNFRSCLVLAAAVTLRTNPANGATLLGQQVHPGGTLDLQFPLSNYLQQMAAEGGRNPRPTTGRVLLFFPKNFDANRSWPILIVTSTSDLERTSIMDAPAYRDPATKEGWIVLATDATIRPRADSVRWRLSILSGALEMIRKEWPQSGSWPVAFAGFSGGAKRSGIEATMLADTRGFRICGIFMAGINSDELSAACRDFHPPPEFFNTPVWISSGDGDPIAPPGAQEKVYYSIKRTGFKNARLEKFFGSHQLKKPEVQRALRWFREVGKF
jgi:hypothetical protein